MDELCARLIKLCAEVCTLPGVGIFKDELVQVESILNGVNDRMEKPTPDEHAVLPFNGPVE